ncbi:MAG: protein kinase, partial [Candidatus Aminicenantes bacterium]|nr:protein kinase [Candidatus Aminicenantes bacterium]
RDFHLSPTLRVPAQELVTGTLFHGRYRVIEEIGKGGMGRVYKVFDERIREKIALKLLKPEIAFEEKTVERFRNEIRIARRIVHRNVGRMFDLGEDDGTTYITMEYVHGQDLKALVRQAEALPIGKAVSIARQVCEGLVEAHRMGVVHRDLKSGNIMIDKEGNARIMDFGIARSLHTESATADGSIVGTPEYMSPEQVDGRAVDERTDIYALGVILYEMVTGRVPFGGDTPLSIAFKHKTDKPPAPRETNPAVPPELDALILKCLEKDKADRYQTTVELAAELAAIEQDYRTTEPSTVLKRPTTLKKTATLRTLTTRLMRPKVLLPAAGAVGLAVVALLTWVFIRPAQAVTHSVAVVSFENQTGDPNLDYLQKAIPNLLISSLEQSESLSVASWDRLQDVVRQMGAENDAFIPTETAFEVCRQEGIETLVAGSYTKADEMFATSVTVYNVATKAPLRRASARGEGIGSILRRQIDDLSREVVRGVGLSERRFGSETAEIAEMMTTSMDAYNDFLRGREEYERYYMNDARVFLEKAVARDPEFALAHFYLFGVHAFQGDTAKASEALAKFNKIGKRPAGREGEYIEAVQTLTADRNTDKYLGLMKRLVAEFPKEKRYVFELGTFFFNRGRVEEAILWLTKTLELDPNFGPALNIMAYSLSFKNDYQGAIGFLERYAAAQPGDANPHDSLGDLHFKFGKLEAAVAKYQEALAIKPDFGTEWKIAYAYALMEDYKKAMIWAERFETRATTEAIRVRAREIKGLLLVAQGQVSKAMAVLDEAFKSGKTAGVPAVNLDPLLRVRLWVAYDRGEIELFRKISDTRVEFRIQLNLRSAELNRTYGQFYAGLLDTKQGRLAEARRRLAEMKAVSPKLIAEEQRLLEIATNQLERDILLAEGAADEALALFEKAPLVLLVVRNIDTMSQRNVPYVDDFAARAYLLKGDTAKAVAEYERLTGGDIVLRDHLLIFPAVRVHLAELYEKTGQKAKARAEYERVLALYPHADADLPEMVKARARLATLKAAG